MHECTYVQMRLLNCSPVRISRLYDRFRNTDISRALPSKGSASTEPIIAERGAEPYFRQQLRKRATRPMLVQSLATRIDDDSVVRRW